MSSNVAPTPDPDLWLSTKVTIKKYRAMEASKDAGEIAKFIHDRFEERYISPLKSVRKGDDNGFLTMGVCCLLVEGLTAFREGWPTTRGRSEEAFTLFFGKEERFKVFRGLESDFWKGVRCGILHQGETSRGWRLNFTQTANPLYEPALKRVNCIQFLREMENVLGEYRNELASSPWESAVWVSFRTKMEQTIKDCIG